VLDVDGTILIAIWAFCFGSGGIALIESIVLLDRR
jgi:hypothetical protein